MAHRIWRQLLLAIAGVTVVAGPFAMGVLSVRQSRAQSQATDETRPKFEVASIKPSSPGSRGWSLQPSPGGRFTARNATLVRLIVWAYRIKEFQISGGPSWLNSQAYDIVAKGEYNANKAQIPQMLQVLLEDRLKLTFHREAKELHVYALVITKNGVKYGPNFHEAGDGSCVDSSPAPGQPVPTHCSGVRQGQGQLTFAKVSMFGFANVLSDQLGRPVLDKTGLKGNFDFKLEWTPPDESQSIRPGDISISPSSGSGPSIFTALQDQLGLKLEAQKGSVEVLVIDHAERATEN